jgi:NAD(P)-dependent dehydrogenase (short-subunit alcohol dehydrogenase family)
MDKSAPNKTGNPPNRALVTGGAKRIGASLCLALAREGYDLAIHFHRSKNAAETLARQIEADYGVKTCLIEADLSAPEQWQAMIDDANEALGSLNLLVNNASLFEPDEPGNITKRSWQDHLTINLQAPVFLAQSFARTAPKGSNIVNIIDQRVLALTPKFFSYSIAKSGLFTATQTLAQALGPHGIRVNAIGPGPTLRNARQSEADWQRQNATTLLGHGASPDDICAALVYLIGAKAVTGQMIAVDGGQHLAWETPDVLGKE